MAKSVADKLNSSQKAAILLLNVGEELASKVLQRMSEEEIQRLGNYMASMGSVEPDISRRVNEEFLMRTMGGGAMGISVGSVGTVRRLLESALGEAAAEGVIANLSVPTEDAGIETLRQLDPKAIANFLKNEHPQTMALILAPLDADRASEALAEHRRGDAGGGGRPDGDAGPDSAWDHQRPGCGVG